MSVDVISQRRGWRNAPWATTQEKALQWSQIGASMYVIRMLQFGVCDPPDRGFSEGRFLPVVQQSTKDLEFAKKELEDGCRSDIYEEITKAYAEQQVQEGCYVSSAFVDWSKGKGRFIINLKKQSTHWDKRWIQTFQIAFKDVELVSVPVQWTILSLYHTSVWLDKVPILVLPFVKPLTRYMRSALCCRVLQWIDDYLIVLGTGEAPSTSQECWEISSILDALFVKLGFLRHKEKGVWGGGSTRLEHLGVIIDTVSFRYFVTPVKLTALQQMASKILRTACKGQRWVKENLVREFTGRAISQLLPIPLARFFTRGLYNDMKTDRFRRGRYPQTLVRLSNASLNELKAWQSMLEGDGRLIGGGKPEWNLHTDAADVGFGGTLGRDPAAGADGEVHVQNIWSPLLRLSSITARELMSVRMALETELIQSRLSRYHGQLLLHVDNMAVFHIINNMVSAKTELMEELRALHQLLTELKITFQATWIPSAMNKHADRLSRTWNPRDLRGNSFASASLEESIQQQLVPRYWPLGDAPWCVHARGRK